MTDTRDRLLTATTESFRRRGYNGTSLKHITTAAGAPIGSLYHFFPGGKDELALAAITESGQAYRQLFELIADAAADVPAAITDFFDGAATVLAETDYIDPCPIGTVAREVASTNDMLRDGTGRVFAGWIDAVAARLEAHGLDSDTAFELATATVAALEGGFVLARARRDPEPLRAAGRCMRRLIEQDSRGSERAALT
jgi:AcrR family transcriptional regulator